MKMARTEPQSLRRHIGSAPSHLLGRNASACVADLIDGTSLKGRLGDLGEKAVLVAARSPPTTALALIELDGVARRLTILPPDADPDHFAPIIAAAEVDAVVVDQSSAPSS